MTSEISTKLLKLVVQTLISVAAIIAIVVLSIFASIGGNTVLQNGGSTIILPISISANAPNVLQSLGASFVAILVEGASLYLAAITILGWVAAVIWIFRDELRSLFNWIWQFISRIRIAPP